MALTFTEEKSILKIKQDDKKELIKLNESIAIEEHLRKTKRLDKLLEIAEAGGTSKPEEEA